MDTIISYPHANAKTISRKILLDLPVVFDIDRTPIKSHICPKYEGIVRQNGIFVVPRDSTPYISRSDQDEFNRYMLSMQSNGSQCNGSFRRGAGRFPPDITAR